MSIVCVYHTLYTLLDRLKKNNLFIKVNYNLAVRENIQISKSSDFQPFNSLHSKSLNRRLKTINFKWP
jgi:hypothetical protein